MIEKKVYAFLLSVGLAIFVLGLKSLYADMRKPVKPDFLPVSVWYSGGKARAPMLSTITPHSREEWLCDLEQIKSLGFNTVRTWVEWAHCEPRPGKYNFDNLRLLCELAQKVGLKVIIQMYVDSAPDWVGKKFPDARFEAQSGEKIPSQAAPGFCTDNEGVRKAVLNFYTETAKVAVQYPNFYGWDLWSEPHIVNWALINYVPNVQFCFCPFTKARFRTWLKNKYETLEALNQAWYRNFETWEDVDPPRFGTILSYTDFIDWKNFIYDKLAQDLRMRYDAIRKADKTHVITSHAAVPSIFTAPIGGWSGYGISDDFIMAEQVDFYGTSLYPKHSFPKSHWELWKFMVAIDFSRSANRKNGGFYIGELQGGFGTRGVVVGNPVTPEDLRIWMWSVLAKGARGVNIYAYYPMSSGYESGGYGLINLDGTVTGRAKEAGKIAQLVNDNMKLFLESSPVKAEIALVYNPLAQMVGGEQHAGPIGGHLNSLIGYYRVFTENNIPVDFIHRRDLEASDLSQYKLIIVPYPLMFTQQAADGLKKYIEQGGYVLAEARLAWNDERGFAQEIIPGMGLSEVFGVREARVKMDDQVQMKIIDTSHPVLAKFKQGEALTGSYFGESVKGLTNKPVHVLAQLDDGNPILVASKYGKGETLFMGTFLGLATHESHQLENVKFIVSLIDWAKINRPVIGSHDGRTDTPVKVSLQNSSDGYLLFVINHGNTDEKVSIEVSVKEDGEYNLRDIIEDSISTQKSKDKKLTLERVIPCRDVEVLYIKANKGK
jgi:beta-galactosidase